MFYKNNYKPDFAKHNTYKNNELNETNNLTTVTATIPYIKGTSEIISRILRPYNIRVAHKLITTLRHILTNVKGKDQPHDRQGAVYKINCADCQATYIGETGRNLNMRLTKHNIDRDSAECLTESTNYIQRITLESWYTNLQQNPHNTLQKTHSQLRKNKRRTLTINLPLTSTHLHAYFT